MSKICSACEQPIPFMGEHYYLSASICKKCNKKIANNDIDDIKVNVEKIEINHKMKLEKERLIEEQRTAIDPRVKEIKVLSLHEIAGKEIVNYFDMVSKEVFIGTGLLSELSSSIDDMFGTKSNAFSNKIDKAKKIAYIELKNEALKMGANAVIGSSVEYMITSHNMLMFSISGTPVLVEE